MWLVLIFLLLPIIEIAVFIQVGGWIGVFPTLALVMLALVAGLALIRQQGLNTLDQLSRDIENGRGDGDRLAHSALKVVAGILLIIPGFFTDALALLLLVPPIRALLIRWGASKVTVRATGVMRRRPQQAWAEPIDAEYEILDDEGLVHRHQPPSGWTRPH
ncbi:MAG: FxsA family protein [Amaricoccus sp.]|uniref:FxsA family protein n=1 Tax=Amaricoccus sp. TaxID=1872485 RepID=UPI0039E28C22